MLLILSAGKPNSFPGGINVRRRHARVLWQG